MSLVRVTFILQVCLSVLRVKIHQKLHLSLIRLTVISQVWLLLQKLKATFVPESYSCPLSELQTSDLFHKSVLQLKNKKKTSKVKFVPESYMCPSSDLKSISKVCLTVKKLKYIKSHICPFIKATFISQVCGIMKQTTKATIVPKSYICPLSE